MQFRSFVRVAATLSHQQSHDGCHLADKWRADCLFLYGGRGWRSSSQLVISRAVDVNSYGVSMLKVKPTAPVASMYSHQLTDSKRRDSNGRRSRVAHSSVIVSIFTVLRGTIVPYSIPYVCSGEAAGRGLMNKNSRPYSTGSESLTQTTVGSVIISSLFFQCIPGTAGTRLL
jgi:hypothetical protein